MEKFQKVIIIWQNSAWKRAQNFFSPSSCCQHIFCCRFSCKATPARENSQLRVTERRNVSYQKVANPARRCSNNNVRTINGKSFVKLRFIARGERETDRTHLPSENKLNTKMEASLDLVITWMFTPMVILVAFLQVGFFNLFTFSFNYFFPSALAEPVNILVSIF